MFFLTSVRSIRSVYLNIRCLSTFNCNWAAIKTVQEKVDPYTKIHINCAYDLKIVPYDLLDCPDSNILKATVKHGEKENSFAVKVSEKLVSISSKQSSEGAECILEVPIKADLQIHNNGNTSIADLYSDDISVESTGNIETKGLRSTNIKLCSTAGNITCRGITLAQNIVASTTGRGNIFLDKLQGASVSATTESGKISVNASYSNKSSFQTIDGDLELKSIHKDCTVQSSGGKNVIMNGFYGTLNANISSENVSLQLSEIVANSNITATSTQTLQLNLADTVFETSSVTVNAPNLELDSNIDEKSVKQNGNSTTFGKSEAENTLHVKTNGSVVLRKMSWADSFSFGGVDAKNE
ncbi:uncharacterized protein LOC128722710 [Anopheles nili]|uniref:uncharacterized protein LOC128722710 n=1 Tax=Anopheles nili TaxID=185578 RepID=UPI00237BDBF1|nr:uncharacterized protein LOC128722710 [Anopheles nili]